MYFLTKYKKFKDLELVAHQSSQQLIYDNEYLKLAMRVEDLAKKPTDDNLAKLYVQLANCIVELPKMIDNRKLLLSNLIRLGIMIPEQEIQQMHYIDNIIEFNKEED